MGYVVDYILKNTLTIYKGKTPHAIIKYSCWFKNHKIKIKGGADMSTFKVSEFVHLGIHKGVESCEWSIAFDEQMTKILKKVKVTGYNDLVLNDNMQIPSHLYQGDSEPTTLTNTYWNGDSPIWVSVVVIMNGRRSPPFKKKWTPHYLASDGTEIPPKNPIDFDNLEKYNRSSNDK